MRTRTNDIYEITFGMTKLNHQMNTTIRGKLKVEHTTDETQSYQKNWLQYIKRMEHSQIPRMALEYKPTAKVT
jgi:hypothetical protein